MPRDGSGTYTRPPGTIGVPDTTIESTKYNSFTADVEYDLNQPRPVPAGGTGASTPAAARDNLDAEVAGQQVTNFDTHTWEGGSFFAFSSATNPPVAAHGFIGTVQMMDANNITVQARDLDGPTSPGIVYVRHKRAGIWSAWVAEGAAQFVELAGDTMTGPLTINSAGGAPALNVKRNGAGSIAVFEDDRLDGTSYIQINSQLGAAMFGTFVNNPAVLSPANPANYLMNWDTNNLIANLIYDLNVSKVSPIIALNSTAAGQNHITGRKGGLDRWTMQFGNNAAESGGNVGSDFALYRYNDAGGGAARAFGINRANGAMTIDSNVQFNAGFATIGITPADNPGLGNTTFGFNMRQDGFGPIIFYNRNNYGGIYIGQNIDGSVLYWTRSGVTVGSINVTATSTGYATSSDERLKEDLKSFDAGNIIDDTKVYDFAWKATGERAYGVIAQQAVNVYATPVTYDKDKDWWGVDYSKYVPVILQELKALRARVAQLEGRLDTKPP